MYYNITQHEISSKLYFIPLYYYFDNNANKKSINREIYMDTVLVIMLKDKKTGFFEKELASLNIEKNDEYIVNMYAYETREGLKLNMRLSTEKDVEDWEYEAIFDYYDTQVFENIAENAEDIDDSYNPVWEITLDYGDDIGELEEKIVKVLECHKKELNDVYETIADKKGEYTNE